MDSRPLQALHRGFQLAQCRQHHPAGIGNAQQGFLGAHQPREIQKQRRGRVGPAGQGPLLRQIVPIIPGHGGIVRRDPGVQDVPHPGMLIQRVLGVQIVRLDPGIGFHRGHIRRPHRKGGVDGVQRGGADPAGGLGRAPLDDGEEALILRAQPEDGQKRAGGDLRGIFPLHGGIRPIQPLGVQPFGALQGNQRARPVGHQIRVIPRRHAAEKLQ